jgi:hypothetical protein
VIAARKLSSALSAANAIAAHLRDWLSTHPPKSDGTLKTLLLTLSFPTDSVNMSYKLANSIETLWYQCTQLCVLASRTETTATIARYERSSQ